MSRPFVRSSDPRDQLADIMRWADLIFDPAVHPEGTTAETLELSQVKLYVARIKPVRDAIYLGHEEGKEKLRTNPPHGLMPRPKGDGEPEGGIIDIQEPVLSKATLNAIQAEATRAHIVHGNESMFGPHNSARRLAILLEEYGEAVEELDYLVRSVFLQMQLGKAMGKVAHELTYDSAETIVKLMVELNQVSAMSASWYEVLRRQLEGKPNGR